MQPPIILFDQTDGNYAPLIYGMLADKRLKPVHRELWAIIRDKQKYDNDGILVNAVCGLATLMNVSHTTIETAIQKLVSAGWLLCRSSRGRRTLFRAVNISKKPSPQEMLDHFERVFGRRVKSSSLKTSKPIPLSSPETGKLSSPETGDNSTYPDNKTLLYTCRDGDNGKLAVQSNQPPPYNLNRVGEELAPYEPAAGG